MLLYPFAAPLFAIANAAPVPSPTSLKRESPIHPHTQSCHATQHGLLVISYNVHIGEPYNDGSGCESIRQKLQHATNAISSYRCYDDGHGDTALHFNSLPTLPGIGDKINGALSEAYPSVVELGDGFDCPDH